MPVNHFKQYLFFLPTILLCLSSNIYGQRNKLTFNTSHTREITSISFSPNGKLMATGSKDKTVRLWDVSTGRVLHSFYHLHELTIVRFSPDGHFLASADQKNTIKIWDIDSSCLHATLRGSDAFITDLRFTPDSKTLTSCSKDNTVVSWNTKTGAKLNSISIGKKTIKDITIGPDCKLIAYCTLDSMFIFDLHTKKTVYSLKGHSYALDKLQFSTKAPFLASRSIDNTINIWNISTKELILSFREPSLIKAPNFQLSPDGSLIARMDNTQNITVWEVNSGKKLQSINIEEIEEPSSALCFSADNSQIISGRDNGGWDNWDRLTGVLLQSSIVQDKQLTISAFSPNDKWIASTFDNDKTLEMWNLNTGQLEYIFESNSNINALAFSPDNRLMASGNIKNQIQIWDIDSNKLIQLIEPLPALRDGYSESICFSPDSKLIACGDWTKATVWEVATGTLLHTISGHDGNVKQLCFSPDSTFLAIGLGNPESNIIIWDLEKALKVMTLTGLSNSIETVRFSEDGQLIIAKDHSSNICIWDIATGATLFNSDESEHYFSFGVPRIIDVQITPNNTSFLSYHIDGTLNCHDINSGKHLHRKHLTTFNNSVIRYNSDYTMAALRNNENVKIFNLLEDTTELIKIPSFANHTFDFNTNKNIFVYINKKGSINDDIINVCYLNIEKKNFNLMGHKGVINAIDLSLDGKLLVSGGEDKMVKIWDIRSKQLIHTFKKNQGKILAVRISPDGTLVAACSSKKINVWNIDSGILLHTFHYATSHYNKPRIHFSSDNKYLLYGNSRKKTKLWNLETGSITIRKEFQGYNIHKESFAYKKGLLGLTKGETIEIFDFNSKRLIQSLQKSGYKYYGDLIMSADGRFVAYTGRNSSEGYGINVQEISSGITFRIIKEGNDARLIPVSFDIENKSLYYICYKDNNTSTLNKITIEANAVILRAFDKGNAWVSIMPNEQVLANEAGKEYLYYVSDNKTSELSRGDLDIFITQTIAVPDSLLNKKTINKFPPRVKSSVPQATIASAPPSINWISNPSQEVSTPVVTLTAEIRSESPIFSYDIVHNKSLIENTPVDENYRRTTFDIELEKGNNTIFIRANNSAGNKKSSPLNIKYIPSNSQRNYAVIFANENYDSIATLPNVIKGAYRLKQELEETFGFEAVVYPDLNKREIEKVIQSYEQKKYKPNDQLLIIYSGHGDIEKKGNRDIGHLASKEAKFVDGYRFGYIRHDDLADEVDAINCRHILIILDACYSSVFGANINSAITGADPKSKYLNGKTDFKNQIKKMLKEKSRLYFSSGKTKTLAGTNEKASPFFEAILVALTKPHNKRDGIVSFAEIKLDLTNAQLNPAPKGGSFGSHHPEGNFIFIVKEKN